MKSRKLWALILFLVGVIACVVAFQRFIVYTDASDSARNFGYETDRASGQKRIDMREEEDRRHDLTKAPQIEAFISGFFGVGLLVTSLILLLGHFVTRNKGKDTMTDKNG